MAQPCDHVAAAGGSDLQTLNSWLDCPGCEVQYGYSQQRTTMRDARQLLDRRYIQWVSDGRLLISDYDDKEQTLMLMAIGSTPITFPDVKPPGHTFQYIAATEHFFLAYSHFYKVYSQKASVFLFDVKTLTHEIVASWDFSVDLGQRAMSQVGSRRTHARLGCSVRPGGQEVLLLGPTEHWRRHGHSWGCKILDLKKKQFTKDIHIDGYSWGAAAAFNPRPDRSHMVSLVCCRRFEFCEDFSRPNVTGVLVNYDLTNDSVTAVLGGIDSDSSQKWCSSEMLAFSLDGNFLFIRRGPIVNIVDAESLVYLKSVESDTSQLRPGHYSLTMFYKFFPALSPCSRYFTTLCGQTGRSPEERVTACVATHSLPVMTKYITLGSLCRQVIRSCVIRHSDVQALPLPTRLKDYLLYL